MFATLFSATLVSLLAMRGVRAGFAVNSPAFVQCAPVHLTWEETKGPYNVLVVDEADPCSDALVDLGDHSGSSITWNVTLPAGKKILVSVEDSVGNEAWTQNITVGASSDTSCLSAADRAAVSKESPSSAAPSSAPSSAAPSVPTSPTINSPTTPDSPNSPSTPNEPIVPVGAVNNGILGPNENGAFSMRQLYTPAMVLSALGAALAVAL